MGEAMTVGVKYCGGCNPRYDRVALVARLAADHPSLRLEPAQPGVYYDLLLVVCGCSARCADTAGLENRLGRLTISSEADLAAVEKLFKKGMTH